MISSRPLLAALPVLLLLGFLSSSAASVAKAAEKRGRIQGESHVNLRSGPDLSFPPLTVLKSGEEVRVEEGVKSWYRVTLADGRHGYIHKTLVGFAGKPAVAAPVEEPKQEEATPEAALPEPPPAPVPPPETRVSRIPPQLWQLFQWKGWVPIKWLGAAVCVFVLGWIYGGNYYLKRDRARTSKLHL